MNQKKIYNFSAGPSKVPEEVMQIANKEFLNYDGIGASVMELSHRSPTFEKIIKTAEQDLRNLLKVPNDYKILFMQGGGNGQFAAIPLNLCPQLNEPVDYIVTGVWSDKAAKEAEKYCKVNRISNPNKNYTYLPDYKEKLNPNAKYVYYCDNETVHGIEFHHVPEIGPNQLLVCDMSSNFLTRFFDISKFDLVFAGAQKNVGIAGVCIVIVKESLLNQANPLTPTIFNYKITADNTSLYNTPPTYAIYISGLCLKFISSKGGVKNMEQISNSKSQLVYSTIENSNGFYHCAVKNDARSRVNIPFRIGSASGDSNLEKKFLDEAAKKGMIQLKGHRSVGGIRVSLFNAITLEETKDFIAFMQDFQKSNS